MLLEEETLDLPPQLLHPGSCCLTLLPAAQLMLQSFVSKQGIRIHLI